MKTVTPAKILVIDDNEVNRYSTGRILKSGGFEVIEAASGQEGLARSFEYPDLILLDVNLPDIDGFQVCQMIRTESRTAQIPIVHTSATFVSDDDRIQGLDVGADGYLTRPIEPRVLIATIRACLRARRAETEREKFAMLVEQSRDLIAIFDATGSPIYMNQAGLEIAGVDSLTAAQVTQIRELFFPEELAWLESEFLPTVSQVGHGECEIRLKNRRTLQSVWMNCSLVIQTKEDGQAAGYSAVCRVVSEQKALEDKLRMVAIELSDSNRRMNEFLATLAHELRNPMSPIRTGLEVIRMAGDDVPAIQSTRAMMERQALQMIRLIDDLLDLSRITQGKLTLRQARIDLADVLDSAVDAIRPAIDEKEHRLNIKLPDEPIYLMGDPNRLTQVFANILNNAVKYTPENGDIAIVGKRESDQIVISIKDNGVGIPFAMQERIFEMFTQIDRSIEQDNTGLGIGLTLVKRLVEMHRGSVAVSSEGPDRGSEFVVRLPTVPAATDADVERLEHTGLHVRHRVLVVDDNRDSAVLLGLVLKVLGNEIQLAHDGIEAVRVAGAYRPNVIFMDLGMPKLNGYDAARQIRQEEWGRDIVMVALTGWGQDEDKQRTHDAGFNFHLTKPAEPAAIQQLLNTITVAEDQQPI